MKTEYGLTCEIYRGRMILQLLSIIRPNCGHARNYSNP
jgi:hypothetical protein